MRLNPTMMLVSLCLLVAAATPTAADPVLDCSQRSLAHAVARAPDRLREIAFTGTCAGPIVIQVDGLTLRGVGTAVIDGGGQDAVTVAGASGVVLTGIEIRNGLNGIVAVNGAHLSLRDLNVHDNAASGISLQTGSSAVLGGVTTGSNGFNGLDVLAGSAATVTGALTASGNAVFGINVNGSSFTVSAAAVTATANTLGIQIATGANAFLSDRDSVIIANNNLSTGLTIVSGAHMVSFGGTINASGNPAVGVSVNSKAGLDLDAASTLNSSNNGTGVLIQHESVMTVFNTTQFSGVPGNSTVNARNNTGSGVRVLTGSLLQLTNQAQVNSTQNGASGLIADNGAGLTLVNSTLNGNTATDLQLTFGARADVRTSTFDEYACDATVLVRGTAGITCPH
jgi:hypothetical protein